MYDVCFTTGLSLFQFRHQDMAFVPSSDLAPEHAIYLVTPKHRLLATPADFIPINRRLPEYVASSFVSVAVA